jgi:hypothetical protein
MPHVAQKMRPKQPHRPHFPEFVDQFRPEIRFREMMFRIERIAAQPSPEVDLPKRQFPVPPQQKRPVAAVSRVQCDREDIFRQTKHFLMEMLPRDQ